MHTQGLLAACRKNSSQVLIRLYSKKRSEWSHDSTESNQRFKKSFIGKSFIFWHSILPKMTSIKTDIGVRQIFDKPQKPRHHIIKSIMPHFFLRSVNQSIETRKE